MSNDNKKSDGKESIVQDSTPASEIKIDKAEMATVESPPLAPVLAPIVEPIRAPADAAKPEPVAAEAAHASEGVAAEASKPSSFSFPKMPPLGERARWRGLIAASVTFAAGVGAAIGAVAVAPKNNPASVSAAAAAAQEREVMQKTIQKLNQEMSSLRSSLETQAKSTSAQLGKLTDKIKDNDKIVEASRRAAAASDITGSISAPATVPVPTPRPPSTLKPAVIEGWSIRSARDGQVLVEGRGEIFEVVPGVPLPGLGVVEDVKRENGRWVVVTAKGIIVASNRPPARYYDRY